MSWVFSPALPELVEDGSVSRVVQSSATCPPQIDRPAPLPAAVTNDETFFIVRPLSSPLSPIPSASVPSVHSSGPNAVLVDDGFCFSHSDGRGGLTIVSKLRQYRITHFTIDNSAVDSAIYHPYHPKRGTLWGLVEGDLPSNLTARSMYVVSGKATYVMLAAFCFNPALSVSETYSVQDTVADHVQLKFSVFYLEIENNWGGSHTLLCHIKLHGEA